MNAPELDPRLIERVLAILLSHPQGIPEHALLKQLSAEGYDCFCPSLDPLALFQSHFLLFHLLYRQADSWREQGYGVLQIDCLNIGFHPSDSATSPGLVIDNGLKRYYLDYAHYLSTQTEDVIALLNQFWQQISLVQDDESIRTAKICLEFNADSNPDLNEINRQYRRLSQRHHPDRGGDTRTFQEITQSAQILRQYYKK